MSILFKRIALGLLILILGLTFAGCIDNRNLFEFDHIEVTSIELASSHWGMGEGEEFYLEIPTVVSEDYEFISERELIVSKEGVIIQYHLGGRFQEITSPRFGHYFVPRTGIRNRLDFARMGYSKYYIPLTLRENDAIQVTYFMNDEGETVGIAIVKVDMHQGYPLRIEIRADLRYSENTPLILKDVLFLYDLQEVEIEGKDVYSLSEANGHFLTYLERLDIALMRITEGKESFIFGETEFYMFTLSNSFAEVEVPLFASEPVSFCGQTGVILSEEYIFVRFELHTVPTSWLPGVEEYFLHFSTRIEDDFEEDIVDVVVGDILSGDTWMMQTMDYYVMDEASGEFIRRRYAFVVKCFGGFSVSFLFLSLDLDATELTEQSFDDGLQAIISGVVQY